MALVLLGGMTYCVLDQFPVLMRKAVPNGGMRATIPPLELLIAVQGLPLSGSTAWKALWHGVCMPSGASGHDSIPLPTCALCH